MSEESPLVFKIASTDAEFEQIHKLNYQTFVEEIPQHRPNDERRLVDVFHGQNTYLIAVRGRRLVGMMAWRGERPFSIDGKLPDVDRYLPPGRRPCEVRLLATTLDARNGVVFRGLVDLLARQATQQGFDLVVISGTLRQIRLYRHLGFIPFGELIGSANAPYQPMYLTLEAFRRHGRVFSASGTVDRKRVARTVSFLPGPVTTHPDVVAAFHRTPVSCRSAAFVRDFQATRRSLCRIVNARHVQILMGSGTVANDVIAAGLSSGAGPGLVLTNGAFGERLVDHATRFGLRFSTLERPWGTPFDRAAIENALDAHPVPRWLWGVHAETSTGMLNDLALWKVLCEKRGVKLHVDAISSFCNAPLDLRGVALAAAASGKGLAAFPGLAFVFHHDSAPPISPRLPRYLDLGFYAAHDGMPFTISSNLVHAAQAAAQRFRGDDRFAQIEALAGQLRRGLRALGLRPISTSSVFPAVTVIPIPEEYDAQQIGQSLAEAGVLVHYRTPALRGRNWIQVSLMGADYPADAVEDLLGALGELLGRSPRRSYGGTGDAHTVPA